MSHESDACRVVWRGTNKGEGVSRCKRSLHTEFMINITGELAARAHTQPCGDCHHVGAVW
jgi:hypothetical protein